MAVQTPTDRISYADFLALPNQPEHAEWVDGEVVPLTPPSDQHQNVAGFLAALFRLYAEAKQLGTVRAAPFQMKTGPELPGREPDVLFVARAHEERIRPTHLDGPADLVVEVVSPESRTRDRGEKFYEYEQGGVREYWLVDPLRRRAELYRRSADGTYETALMGDPPRLRSEVMPGLWIDPEWLWGEATPPLMTVLREWGLV